MGRWATTTAISICLVLTLSLPARATHNSFSCEGIAPLSTGYQGSFVIEGPLGVEIDLGVYIGSLHMEIDSPSASEIIDCNSNLLYDTCFSHLEGSFVVGETAEISVVPGEGALGHFEVTVYNNH